MTPMMVDYLEVAKEGLRQEFLQRFPGLELLSVFIPPAGMLLALQADSVEAPTPYDLTFHKDGQAQTHTIAHLRTIRCSEVERRAEKLAQAATAEEQEQLERQIQMRKADEQAAAQLQAHIRRVEGYTW